MLWIEARRRVHKGLLHSEKTSFGMLKRMRRIRRARPVLPPPSAFTGFRFPQEVILLAVRWYLRYGLSYRDLEELLAERGVKVDHVTIYRWVRRFTPLLAEAARPCRHAVGGASGEPTNCTRTTNTKPPPTNPRPRAQASRQLHHHGVDRRPPAVVARPAAGRALRQPGSPSLRCTQRRGHLSDTESCGVPGQAGSSVATRPAVAVGGWVGKDGAPSRTPAAIN